MLASTQLVNSSNEKDLSTYMAIPLDSLKNPENYGNLEVIQNIVIKQLEDGSICLVEDEGKQNDCQAQYPLPFTTTTPNINSNLLQKTSARNRTILLQPSQKTSNPDKPPLESKPTKKLLPKTLDKKFKCIKCDNVFDTLLLYRDHMKWHRCQKKFKCPKCTTGYNVENNLKIHMALMHSEESTKQCPICDANLTFQRAASLKSHLILHQVEELYTCDECSGEFDKEDDFIKHLVTHATVKKYKEKPLTCSYCKVEFRDVKELKAHVSDHIKLKRTFAKPKRLRRPGSKKNTIYSCTVCDKSFIKNSLLERHQRIHSGERPYKCQFCDRGFTQKGTLQIHISRHTGVKPFSCTLCPAKFNQKGNLRVHTQKTHTFPKEGQKMYKCCQCTCIFKKIATLNSHVTKAHLNRKETSGAEGDLIDEVMEQLKELQKQTSVPTNEENADKNKEIEPKEGVIIENNNLKNDTLDFAHLSESINDDTVRKYFVRLKKIGDVRWYFCNYCAKQFKKPSDLMRHIRVHTKEKPFKCKQCKAAFSFKSNLISHVKTHKKVDYRCKICNTVHTQKGQRMYECCQCTCMFKKIATLNRHVTKAHLNRKEASGAEGDLIDEVMEQLKELQKQTSVPTIEENADKNKEIQPKENNNLKNDTLDFAHLSESIDDTVRKYFVRLKKIGGVRWYFCNYCTKQFKKPSDLMRHMRVHTKEKPFKCKQCKAAFSFKSNLISHVKTHKKIDYKCKICNSTFASVRILNAHLRKHYFDSLPKWHCITCGYLFDELEKGSKHREEKGRDKPHIIRPYIHNILKQPLFQTAYGTLAFKPPKTRFPNTGTESPTLRPFHCTICDARFTRKINLKRHIQFHNGERKFECHMCPKTFITSYKLKEHLNYHDNVKNYPCTVCDKKFVTATLLKRHVISHNTHKPYQCPYCTKTFKTLLLCRTHINKVHKKEVVPKCLPESNESISDTLIDSENLQTTSEFLPNQSSNITVQEVQENVSEDLPANSDNIVIQHFLPETSNSIQILSANVEDEDPNHYQTIYVNIDELPFLDSSNLNLNSSLQPQNTDALLMNPMNDLQGNNIIFSIDSLKPGLDLPPVEIFDNSHNETIDVSSANTLPSIAEISTKTIKLNNFSEKTGTDKTVNMNQLLDNNPGLYSNLEFTEGLSLPMSVAEGTSVFSTTTPTTIFQPTTSTELNDTEDIYESTNIMCITCSKLFTNLESFQNHPCDILTDDKPEITNLGKSEEISDNDENSDDTEQQSKELFECHICKKILANKFSHSRHVISHESKPTYECGVCQKVIQGRSVYVKHLASHTGSSLLRTCKYCFKDFKKPSDLKRHLRTHTGEKPFGCSLCDKKFSLKSTLESHARTHGPASKQFNCNVCNSFFSSKSSLKVHMTIHTGQRPQSCSFCNQKFRTSGNRKSHERLMHLSKSRKSGVGKHTKITNVLESVASEVMKDVNSTHTDDNIPEEGNEIVSAQDDSLSANLEILPQQIINLSDSLLPEDQISLDPVMLLQQLQMSGVILTNDNNEPVSSLMLDDVELLNVENTKDNVVISLPSTQSNVTISEDSLLKPEKPKTLECDICHKMYASKQILRKHRKKIHGVNKKYPCIKCDKGFDTQDELNKHIKLHAGYRPFSCLYCANSFTEEHSLKTHVKRIHEHSNTTKETASALLNMKFDFPTSNMEEPLFNNFIYVKEKCISFS